MSSPRVGEPKDIPLKRLELWQEGNVRKTERYADIDDLARNIQRNGLIVPLLVLEDKDNPDRYKVFSGQRRLEACRRIGYSPVPCIVVEKADMRRARILSLSENIYRRAMSADDISDTCDYLYKELKSVSDVAEHLGVSEPTVRKYLGYRNVPDEIKELVRQKKITASQAIIVYTQFLDVESQLLFARELAKIPRRKRRLRSKFVQAIREARPTDTVEEVRTRARRLAAMKSYNILLPPKTSDAIEKVAIEWGIEAEDVIVEILEKYVSQRLEAGQSILE